MNSSKSKKIQHARHGLVACDRPGGVNGARRWHKHVRIANENEYSDTSINEEKADLNSKDQINTEQIQPSSSESPPSAPKIINTTTPVASYPSVVDITNPTYSPFYRNTYMTNDPIVPSPTSAQIPYEMYNDPSPTFVPSSQVPYHEPRHAFVPSNANLYSDASINEEKADHNTKDQINIEQVQPSSSTFPHSTQKRINTTTPVASYPSATDDVSLLSSSSGRKRKELNSMISSAHKRKSSLSSSHKQSSSLMVISSAKNERKPSKQNVSTLTQSRDNNHRPHYHLQNLRLPLPRYYRTQLHSIMYRNESLNDIVSKVNNQSTKCSSIQRLRPVVDTNGNQHEPSEERYLNDELINHYFALLNIRELHVRYRNAMKSPCIFFSSYFMQKLYFESREYDYQNVTRWSDRHCQCHYISNIFAADKIIIPINEYRTHWLLIVVFMKEKKIQVFNSMGDRSGNNRIMQREMRYLDSIMKYVQDEWIHKIGLIDIPNLRKEWTLHTTVRELTPLQTNGVDCGLFMSFMANLISMNLHIFIK